MIEPICCFETSLTNYQSTRRYTHEKRRSHTTAKVWITHRWNRISEIWIACFKVQNRRQGNKRIKPFTKWHCLWIHGPWPFKKNAFIFKGQRVQKTIIFKGQSVFLWILIPKMKTLLFFETSQTTVKIVESHFQVWVPQITLPVTHSYTMYSERHSWVHDFVECASHVHFIANCHDCNTNRSTGTFQVNLLLSWP